MAFKKEVKYGSVTLDFVAVCAKKLGLDLSKKENLRVVLYRIGFEVSVPDGEGGFTPCQIDRMNNVNVRCADKPYLYRKTTVFSGRLRELLDFPGIGVYDEVDILDVSGSGMIGTLVDSLPFDQPASDKVNTRKYTKREDRSEILMLDDLPEMEDLENYLAQLKEGV